MNEKYKLKEAQIPLQNGVTLRVEVDTMDGLKSLLADLSSAKFQIGGAPPPPPSLGDDPISRLETKAALSSGSIAKAKIVAFKDNVPQLLRPNIFSNVTDALLVLLFSVETGLATSKIDYEAFKGLYEAQNIKSGSPMGMLLSNLRVSNYLDKSIYSADKSLSLTAKGEEKAIEVIKSLCK